MLVFLKARGPPSIPNTGPVLIMSLFYLCTGKRVWGEGSVTLHPVGTLLFIFWSASLSSAATVLSGDSNPAGTGPQAAKSFQIFLFVVVSFFFF